MAALNGRNSSIDEDAPYKGSTLDVLAIVLFCIVTVAIFLRCWSRAINPARRFGADDWLALIAWPLAGTVDLLTAAWTHLGLGHHVEDVPYETLVRGLKVLYAGFICYNISISLLRLSVVSFYLRIFASSNQRLKYVLWATFATNIAWMVSFVCVAIFNCTPVDAFWDRKISSYRCNDTIATQYGSSISSVILDFWLLILPLPILLRLRMPLSKRLSIISIFVAGYCVICFTIGRLVAVVRAGDTLETDFTWGFVVPLYWYDCEISVASISVSLPAIYFLINRGIQCGIPALFNNRTYSTAEPTSFNTIMKKFVLQDDAESSEWYKQEHNNDEPT